MASANPPNIRVNDGSVPEQTDQQAPPPPSRVDTLRSQLNEVREVLSTAVEKAISRDASMDSLLAKCEELKSQSCSFRDNTSFLTLDNVSGHEEKDNDHPGSPSAIPSAYMPNIDKFTTLQNQVQDVREIMTANVERILARGERLEDLLEKSEDLEAGTNEFRNTSRRVERHMCWRNAKCNCLIAGVIFAIVIALILVVLYETGVFKKA